MGLALLAWRDVVYAILSVFGQTQSDQPRIGVRLLGCFSIQKFEITKINFLDVYKTRTDLVLLVW